MITNGPKLFKSVLARPAEMPQDIKFESLLYLASTAFESKTGKEFDYDAPLSYETFSNRKGWRKPKKA